MLRNLSFILVTGFMVYSCKEKSVATNENKFDVKSYYKSNQNSRVLNYIENEKLLLKKQPLEIYFINNSKSMCNSCLISKHEEILEILKNTKVESVVIFNDSSYYREIKNPFVIYKYCETSELKNKNLFHSNPWFYSYRNKKIVDKKLTTKICDSLLNRF